MINSLARRADVVVNDAGVKARKAAEDSKV